MKHGSIGTKQRVNVLLDTEAVAAARRLGLNISQTASRALVAEVALEERRRWKADNAEWIEAHRKWVDENELPLERYRLF